MSRFDQPADDSYLHTYDDPPFDAADEPVDQDCDPIEDALYTIGCGLLELKAAVRDRPMTERYRILAKVREMVDALAVAELNRVRR